MADDVKYVLDTVLMNTAYRGIERHGIASLHIWPQCSFYLALMTVSMILFWLPLFVTLFVWFLVCYDVSVFIRNVNI